jgi:acyl carrier protein
MEKLRPEGEVSIGRPIANTSLFVLDAALQPVPIGVAGELYIGGDGVTPGYLDRPELTRERFVEIEGQRAYRTGDLVKFLPDGRLLFLGRLDHQVKIRGHRVELGEIEETLCRHNSIEDAIVAATQDPDAGQSLAAYVILRNGSSPRPMDLRRFLESQLPSYMIPGSFVFLDAFPRTPNGKIDRKRLPRPAAAEPRDVIQPRSATEREIASFWQEVLHVAEVGIHDNFFDLGGHSLTAVMLTGKIRSAIDAQFPLRAVLDHPTVAELAEEIDKLRPVVTQPKKRIRPPILPANGGDTRTLGSANLR